MISHMSKKEFSLSKIIRKFFYFKFEWFFGSSLGRDYNIKHNLFSLSHANKTLFQSHFTHLFAASCMCCEACSTSNAENCSNKIRTASCNHKETDTTIVMGSKICQWSKNVNPQHLKLYFCHRNLPIVVWSDRPGESTLEEDIWKPFRTKQICSVIKTRPGLGPRARAQTSRHGVQRAASQATAPPRLSYKRLSIKIKMDYF